MGYGNYSASAHRALLETRTDLASGQVFSQSTCHPLMRPHGVRLRESRDSPDHPNSVGVIFALDVSASMGDIPQELATKTLPTFMETVLGVLPDAQVMFMAFGNAYADKSPLQVGQFESEAVSMDRWLSMIHMESGGGGLGESYDLALYFASRHTALDCYEKRQKKGYLFMTGDEPGFASISPPIIASTLGATLSEPILGHDMVSEVQERFHTFFLVPEPGRAAQSNVWARWLHERCIVLDRPADAALAAALLIAIQEREVVDRASILALAISRSGGDAELAERLTKTVIGFAEALAKGPIAGPDVLPVGGQPGFRG